MKQGWLVASVFAGSCLAGNSLAFDTQTHALITRVAYKRSELSKSPAASPPGSPDPIPPEDRTLSHRLGWDRLGEFDRFQLYWNSDQRSRYYKDGGNHGAFDQLTDFPALFEKCQMRDFIELDDRPRRELYQPYFSDTVESRGYPTILPIQNWLVRGAIREDDMGDGAGWPPLLGARCAWAWFNTVGSQQGQLTRSLRHFYDPDSDHGLVVAFVSEYPKSVDWALGNADSFVSPAVPAEGSARNTYSYLDARNAYWWALTRRRSIETGSPDTVANRDSDAKDRMILWATMFRSLGNVVHLLQDAAQPQHTRLDPHSGLDPAQQQAFEAYTNARILGFGDAGEFVRGFFSSQAASELPIPDMGSYGIAEPVMFSIPLRFFTTRSGLGGPQTAFLSRAGIADYSNRGFFTGGTLPGSEWVHPHDYPPRDFSSPESGYWAFDVPCEDAFEVDGRLQSVVCKYFTHEVPDAIHPEYAHSQDVLPPGFSLPMAPIAADGIFRRHMAGGYEAQLPLLTWSPAVLDTIGNLTIPRAIAYSAGMLDFFFRGEIKLTSPPEGLYAVVDQGTPHHVANGIPMDDEGRVFGFKKLRVGIRNITNVDSSGNPTLRDAGSGALVPQTMRAGVDAAGNPTGRLVAIARYHRNPCYQRDLSGEYVVMPFSISGIPNLTDIRIPNGCAIADARTAFQEISVSAPLFVDAGGNLPGSPAGNSNPCLNTGNINTGTHGVSEACESESVLSEFDFSGDPIPINATDLFIQVAYRGPLGLEEDGIAVGMKNIDEPNYISMWNGTDWFYRAGEWVPPEDYPELPLGVEWAETPIRNITVCVGNQTIAVLPAGHEILPTEFIRVGVLSDAVFVPFGIATIVGRYSNFQRLAASRAVRESTSEDATAAPYSPLPFLWFARGTTMGGNFWAPFFAYGDDPEDHTMQSLVLHPNIGGASPGIAKAITAGLEVDLTSCQPRNPN
ncbi:MAG: hypothetical protein KF811_13890 [Dokdonella sp.]|nr:hypothetical protein [Dokdonella sp.]